MAETKNRAPSSNALVPIAQDPVKDSEKNDHLVPQTSNSQLILMHPPKKKKVKQVVLEEDEYLETMEHIIRRDYYPALESLEKALSGKLDPVKVLKAVAGRPISLPLGSNSTPAPVELAASKGGERGATPGPASLSATPRTEQGKSFEEPDTPIHGSQSDPDIRLNPAQDGPSEDTVPKIPKQKKDLRLGQFMALYTSEDNDSFSTLLEEDEKKREEKNMVKLQQIDDSQRLLLLEGDPKRTGVLESWRFQYRNMLMFHANEDFNNPEQPVVEVNQKKPELGRGPTKEIKIENTRFPGGFFEKPKPQDLAAVAAAASSNPSGTPMIGGYKLLRTPSPMVGQSGMETPLVTWGAVVGTPLHLEESHIKGPQFKVPATPSRDQLLWKIDQANQKKRLEKEKKAAPKNKRSGAATPGNLTPGRLSSPMLSPAAQSLLAKGLKGRPTSDLELLSSYQSPRLVSPRQTPTSTSTPSQLSASSSSLRTKRKGRPTPSPLTIPK